MSKKYMQPQVQQTLVCHELLLVNNTSIGGHTDHFDAREEHLQDWDLWDEEADGSDSYWESAE